MLEFYEVTIVWQIRTLDVADANESLDTVITDYEPIAFLR